MLLAFDDWKFDAALGSCLTFGLLHGFDYDHLAAISDITAVQRSWRSGLRLGMIYALGHASIVALLGAAVIEFQFALPTSVDNWTGRIIGLTLLLLGIGVAAGILRKDAHGHSHGRVESRLSIAINGVLWLAWRVRRLWNGEAQRPDRFQWLYTGKSVFLIGVLHGVGAETPTQFASFLLAAQLGGASRGMLGLAAFSVGMLAMNALMTASMGGAFRLTGHQPRLYSAIAWTGAAYSCVVGVIFLFGLSDRLPELNRNPQRSVLAAQRDQPHAGVKATSAGQN